MTAGKLVNTEDEARSRKALYEKMVALCEASGMPITGDVQALLEPLLDGSLGYKEHQAMLKAMLEGIKS